MAVMMQSFTKMFIIVNFNLHQQTIAKTLCEKRNVKGSCCAGRCQLKKRLNEEEKNEKAPNPSNSKEKLEELFCEKKSKGVKKGGNFFFKRVKKGNLATQRR